MDCNASVIMSFEQGNSLFRFQLPSLSIGAHARSIGIYTSGILFACGFWFFLDAAVYSKVANAGLVHMTFVDWIPAICSALGLVIVNSIDKSKLTGDDYGESSVAWKAKLILFIGFALLAGGLAGGIVRPVSLSSLGTNRLGCACAEVCLAWLPVSDAILWRSECALQRSVHALIRRFMGLRQ